MASRRILFSLLVAGLAAAPMLASPTATGATATRAMKPAAVSKAVAARPKTIPYNLTSNTDTPDPSIVKSGSNYFAFSTGKAEKNCSGTTVHMFVPHRSSTALGTWSASPCFADVMPGGPGAWAGGSGANYLNTWAPSVVENNANGTFVLFYTQQKSGTGQMCIGRAQSSSITAPYAPDSTALICPSDGTWALDPQGAVVGGALYLVWRQDPNSVSTRIWAAQYSTDGRTRLTTARLLEDSGSMTWDGPVPNGNRVVENPAAVFWGATNLWYITFSGDDFASNNYATGMAVCGASLTSGPQCTLQAPISKSFFGWSSRGHGGTLKTTPGNLPAPGGMAFVTQATGGFIGASDHAYVALHYNASTTCGTTCQRRMGVFEITKVDTTPTLTAF